MIEFRQPTKEQMEEVQFVASLLEQVMTLILRHGQTRESCIAYEKAQECLMWFNSSVMNHQQENSLHKMN